MEEFIKKVPITRILPNGEAIEEMDFIAREERLSVFLNGQKIISTMCLLGDQDCYALGFLMSEAVIENIDDVRDIRVSPDGLSVFVEAKINDDNISNLFHEKTLTSGCCVGVSANFEGKIIEKFLSQKVVFTIEQIRRYLERFQKNTDLFSLTSCTHKAMLFYDK